MNFTEEEMISKARGYSELVYHYTRENEPSEFDKFFLQLLYEYLSMKEKEDTK